MRTSILTAIFALTLTPLAALAQATPSAMHHDAMMPHHAMMAHATPKPKAMMMKHPAMMHGSMSHSAMKPQPAATK